MISPIRRSGIGSVLPSTHPEFFPAFAGKPRLGVGRAMARVRFIRKLP